MTITSPSGISEIIYFSFLCSRIDCHLGHAPTHQSKSRAISSVFFSFRFSSLFSPAGALAILLRFDAIYIHTHNICSYLPFDKLIVQTEVLHRRSWLSVQFIGIDCEHTKTHTLTACSLSYIVCGFNWICTQRSNVLLHFTSSYSAKQFSRFLFSVAEAAVSSPLLFALHFKHMQHHSAYRICSVRSLFSLFGSVAVVVVE